MESEKNPNVANVFKIPAMLSDKAFEEKLNITEFQYFIHYGDIHYFIGRLLFKTGIGYYAFFCAQQCIELYLKAFLRMKKKKIKTTHNLQKLLEECKTVATTVDEKQLFENKLISFICKRYQPFNDYGRYPIVKQGIEAPLVVIYGPGGDYDPIDYFVYRMRKIVKLPTRMADLLLGHKHCISPLIDLGISKVDPWKLFTEHNINFPQS